MVSTGFSSVVFTGFVVNNTDAPIAIAADGTDGRVLMRVFGRKAPGREVKIERTNVSSWGPGETVIHDSDSMGTKYPFTGQARSQSTNPSLAGRARRTSR